MTTFKEGGLLSFSKPIEEVFNNDEIACLKILSHQLEKKNTQVQNNFNENTLAWTSWIIARLGGWKGYIKQRPPGPITLKKGLDKFELIHQGWILAKHIEKNVSTR